MIEAVLMCGIFGFSGYTNNKMKLLKEMANWVLHRGPDEEGYYCEEDCEDIAFGIRRLSIIDIHTGSQPISNEDGTVWVASNGEIYNYIELREDLIRKGHDFKTKSDTEVLVHLYEDKGLDLADELNGIFSFVLYDANCKRTIVVRDRLGVKPLYYFWDGKRFAFASEIKPLFCIPWIGRDPDWDAISAYLELNYVPAPLTGFKQVKKLTSGTMIILEKGELRYKKYWDLLSNRDINELPVDYEEAKIRLKRLFHDSSRIQLRSDVPVGMFLSGGIDSSTVAAFASQHNSKPTNTFTIKWKDAPSKVEEWEAAELLCRKYDLKYQLIEVTCQDFIDYLPLMIWHMEEPFADSAHVPTYVISRLAGNSVKVILSGGGGDEMFGGYEWYQSLSGLSRLRCLLKAWIKTGGAEKYSWLYARRCNSYPWRMVFREYKPWVMAKDVAATYSRCCNDDEKNAAMANDLLCYLQDDILALNDRITMAASLEGRVPLLDHRIVELAMKLPSSYKINGSNRKIILRDIVKDIIPEESLSLPKQGFNAPVNDWLKGNLGKKLFEIVRNGIMAKEGILNPSRLNLFFSVLKGDRKLSALWIIASLELWFRIIQEGAEKPVGITLDDFL